MKELLKAALQLLDEVRMLRTDLKDLRKAVDENTEQAKKNQPLTTWYPATSSVTSSAYPGGYFSVTFPDGNT